MTQLELRILEFERYFERRWTGLPSSAQRKQQAILAEFDVTPTRYFQLLNQLIDKPAAVKASPQLVNRLRRIRSGRRKSRAESNQVLRA